MEPSSPVAPPVQPAVASVAVKVVLYCGGEARGATLKARPHEVLAPHQLLGLVSRLYGFTREQLAGIECRIDDDASSYHSVGEHDGGGRLLSDPATLAAAWAEAKVRSDAGRRAQRGGAVQRATSRRRARPRHTRLLRSWCDPAPT